MEAKPYSSKVEGLVSATDKQYFADPAINNSALKVIIEKSPGHLKNYQSKSTSAMRIGSLVHSMVLDAKSLSNYLVFTEGKSLLTNKAKEFSANNPNSTVVLEKDWELADLYQSKNTNNEHVKLLRACRFKEVSAFVKINGYRCKAKADAIDTDRGIIYDLKTTSDLGGFVWDAKKYKYHMQRAWYLKIFGEIFGPDLEFKLVVLEKHKPFYCVERTFSKEVCQEGEHLVQEAFDRFTYASTYDDWSGPESTGILNWS